MVTIVLGIVLRKKIKNMNSDNKKMYDEAIVNLLDGIGIDYINWNKPFVTDDEDSELRNKIRTESIAKFVAGLHVKPGRKFDKIIKENSVWGFVAKTDGVLKGIPYNVGDVFKPAGWRGPAKHVRGTIFSDNTNWYQWTGPNYL